MDRRAVLAAGKRAARVQKRDLAYWTLAGALVGVLIAAGNAADRGQPRGNQSCHRVGIERLRAGIPGRGVALHRTVELRSTATWTGSGWPALRDGSPPWRPRGRSSARCPLYAPKTPRVRLGCACGIGRWRAVRVYHSPHGLGCCDCRHEGGRGFEKCLIDADSRRRGVDFCTVPGGVTRARR